MNKSFSKLRERILFRMAIVRDIVSDISESKSPASLVIKSYSDGKLSAFNTVLDFINEIENDR